MSSALIALAQPLIRTALSLSPKPGRLPINDHGTALDPEIWAILRVLARRRQPPKELGVGRYRLSFEEDGPLADFRRRALHRIDERWVPSAAPGISMRVRIYRPSASTAPQPALVFFHGGGFVIGSIETHDGVCSYLAQESGAIVLSFDYRLAPEHVFPAAAEDAVAAFRWTASNAEALGIDPRRIAVGGDSAGGNLSAVASLELREDPHAPCFQMLVYPATDMTRSLKSHQTFAQGFLLEAEGIDFFLDAYLSSVEEQRHALASPLLREDLAGAAPAYVVTAGFDPLRDEGDAYAQALMAAGVEVEHRCEESLIHGFFSLGGLSSASRAAISRAAHALGRALWRTPTPRS